MRAHPFVTLVLWCLAFYLALVVGAWNLAHH